MQCIDNAWTISINILLMYTKYGYIVTSLITEKIATLQFVVRRSRVSV